MDYQIQYNISGCARRITRANRNIRYILYALTGIIMLLTLLWSLGGDWAVTVDAMEDMADAIAQGSGIKDAFGTFCLDILKGAELG